MGGPWRERGFDPTSLRSPRPHSGRRTEVMAREHDEQGGLKKVVLAYIAAIVMSFGLMVTLLHGGW